MAPARRLAAIMFTDMVGFSALAQADESRALTVLDRHNRLLRGSFTAFHGREIKTVGDAFLTEFGSALEAVQCALELQRSLRDYNESTTDDWKIRIRVGIHVGDVVETADDILGDAVNIASRIEPLAEPGGICLSQQVYDQVQNKIPVELVRLPAVALKNIRLPMNVYRVGISGGGVPARAAASPGGSGRHLAVLPLSNISPDPNDEYFSDGLTEELISTLSGVRGLSVIARTSVTPYKSTPKSVAQVGAELGVDTVLEGSVRKAGNRVRITLQLIDAASQRHIWANKYDREVGDVFSVQTDVAERTAEAMRLELSKGARLDPGRPPTGNAEAYDQYLRGLVNSYDRTGRGLAQAVECFERATTLDPDFSEAYSAWANLYVAAAGDYVPMRQVMPKARELAARALALDPDSSDAHSALANLAFQFDHDWKRAESEFEKAIALNPSNVDALAFYVLLLFALERFIEAQEVIRRAIRLDPGGNHTGFLSWILLDSGEVDAAIAQAEQSVRDFPSSLLAQTNLGLFYLSAGRVADARRQAALPMDGADGDERFDRALLNALVGQPEAAREIAAEMERGAWTTYTSKTFLAMLYSVLGEKSRTLDLLEADYRTGDLVLWLWYRGVYFDPVRSDPRFRALLRQYGVPDHPIVRPPRVDP